MCACVRFRVRVHVYAVPRRCRVESIALTFTRRPLVDFAFRVAGADATGARRVTVTRLCGESADCP